MSFITLFSRRLSIKQKILLASVLFLISWIFQSVGINTEGRTWDEEYKVDMGYEALMNLQRGDLSFAAWNDGTEHPMVAKYTYTLAALSHIMTITKDQPLDMVTQQYLQTGRYYVSTKGNTALVVNYDFTLPRLLSAAFNAATVAGVFLIACIFLPPFIALFSSFVLITTPWFLAMGRLITYESLSDALYVSITLIFGYLLTKKQQSIRWYIGTGIVAGVLLWTRYNNAYVFLLLFGWWIIWHITHNSFRHTKQSLVIKTLCRWQLLLIPLVALMVGFATWPLLWIDFPKNFIHTFSQNTTRVTPFSLYYPTYLLYTTPLPYLVLSVIGIAYAIKRHTYYLLTLLWSFFSMLLFYMIFTAPGGGTRYMFSIYIPYALFCGIGLYIAGKWVSERVKRFSIITTSFICGVCIILGTASFSVVPIHPYYLDYYNVLAGGLRGAVNKHLLVSWWGEGQREAGIWLEEHAPEKSSVALKVTPMYVFPPLHNNLVVYPYGTHLGETDFLVVSRSDIPSIKNIVAKYKRVYGVEREGIDLVTVFQKAK